MEFRLLGPLEVVADGRPLPLGNSRARALLALFLVHRNELLTIDRIVDELWPEQPPKTATQVVHVYVSNLRKALESNHAEDRPRVLVTSGRGYILNVDSGGVDIERFEALSAEGRRLLTAGQVADAARAFEDALSLWRGAPLQDLADEVFAQPEIARLGELRLTTLEDRFDAQLAAGRDSELVADLEQLVAANPLRERLRAQLMLALYRAGRQADALETYQRGRRVLVDGLGLEPGKALRHLETRILQQDPELATKRAPAQPFDTSSRPPPRPHRLRVRGAMVALVAIAATAALLTAATTGHAHQRPRVALVLSTPRYHHDPSQSPLHAIAALRAAAKEADVRASVLYGGNRLSGFLHKIAIAARTSKLVIVGPEPEMEQVSVLTRRFPKTRFLVFDSVSDPTASFLGQRNVTGLDFGDRQLGKLAGYLAGLMTRGRQAVSAVGAVPTQSVINLIAGFKAGARLARPGIKVFVNFSQNFLNTGSCASAANSQINRDSHVVFDVAGDCGIGALQVAGIGPVWGLGVDNNLAYLGPQILGSVVKRPDRAIQQSVNLFAAGQLPGGQDLRLNLASGSTGLVGVNARVPKAVTAKVRTLEAKLLSRDQAAAHASASSPSREHRRTLPEGCTDSVPCRLARGMYRLSYGSVLPGSQLTLQHGWSIAANQSGALSLIPPGHPGARLFVWIDLHAVKSTGVGHGTTVLTHVGRTPARLVSWLTTNPDLLVVAPPRPTRIAGIPGTTLTIGVSRSANYGDPGCPNNPRCADLFTSHFWQTPYGIGGTEEVKLSLVRIKSAARQHTLFFALDAGTGTDNKTLISLESIARSMVSSFRLPKSVTTG